MIPTTQPAQRIATLFRRKLTTPWTEKEIRQYKKLAKLHCFDSPNDLSLIENYYVHERKKENGCHRRDLYTFLNNFTGELDRARAWDDQHKKRFSGNGQRPVREVSDREFEHAGLIAKAEIAKLREQLKMT